MASLLAKLLVLKMLFDDDEPLNLILEEALITENNKNLLKGDYQTEQIQSKEIKNALKELKSDNMIELLSEDGKKLDNEDFDFEQIMNSEEEWKYWFRITKNGEKFFNDHHQAYFREELFN